MKFYPQQRVRIRHDANAVTPGIERVKGEICHVVRERQPDHYELDLTFCGYPVLAGELALEPVFDQPQKCSWFDPGIVWRPRELEPAVIRRNRTTPAKTGA